MATSTIIDEAYLPKIRQALVDLDTLENELALAVRAGLHLGPGGLDANKITADINTARNLFQQILNVYFPGM